jgi:hypothetical protein
VGVRTFHNETGSTSAHKNEQNPTGSGGAQRPAGLPQSGKEPAGAPQGMSLEQKLGLVRKEGLALMTEVCPLIVIAQGTPQFLTVLSWVVYAASGQACHHEEKRCHHAEP